MFVRFRHQGYRLQASLMQTRRVAGKVKTEHIASLGSVDAAVSVRDRIDFWSKILERLARLANRVGPEEQGAIYDALHARIPMATPDDQRAVQEENAEADERLWSSMHGMNAASAEEHKALIASAELKLREHESAAAEAAEEAQAAKDRLAKIKSGEAVSGGLGKPMDHDQFVAHLKASGWKPAARHSICSDSSVQRPEGLDMGAGQDRTGSGAYANQVRRRGDSGRSIAAAIRPRSQPSATSLRSRSEASARRSQ